MSTHAGERNLKLKVGLFLLAALALLAAFVFLLGNFSFSRGFRVTVHFNYSGNLQTGAPVRLSGIKVGKIEQVSFAGGERDPITGKRVYVRVVAWLEERTRGVIRDDAEFFVNTQGVLGEQYLEVQPGSFDKPELDLGHAHDGVDPPRTDLIIARLYQFLDEVTTLLRDDKTLIADFLRSGTSVVRTLDKLLTTNQAEIGRLLKDVDGLSHEASLVLGSVRRGVGDGDKLRLTLEHVEELAGSVRRDVGPLIAKAHKALDGLSALTSAVEKDKLKRAIDDLIALSEKADRIASDAQTMVADTKRGKGTAGALLVDSQIYDDLKELVRDLKRNPWKFFWKE